MNYATQTNVSQSGEFVAFQPERELDHNLTSGDYELLLTLSNENRPKPFFVRNPQGSGATITLVLQPWGNDATDTVTREILEGRVYESKLRKIVSAGSTQTTVNILY